MLRLTRPRVQAVAGVRIESETNIATMLHGEREISERESGRCAWCCGRALVCNEAADFASCALNTDAHSIQYPLVATEHIRPYPPQRGVGFKLAFILTHLSFRPDIHQWGHGQYRGESIHLFDTVYQRYSRYSDTWRYIISDVSPALCLWECPAKRAQSSGPGVRDSSPLLGRRASRALDAETRIERPGVP